jgi:hypothetical protein
MGICIQRDVSFPDRLLAQVESQGIGTALAFDKDMGQCVLIGIATGKKPGPEGIEGRGVTFLMLSQEIAEEFAYELLAAVRMIDVTTIGMAQLPIQDDYRTAAERIEKAFNSVKEATTALQDAEGVNLRSWTGMLIEEGQDGEAVPRESTRQRKWRQTGKR